MSSTSHIPVLVIGGYLGAGKTTLINQLLRDATQRIAVVVNDFGSVNIDAALIAEKHDDTIELTNGCICCSVGDSLAEVLFTILDRKELPDIVMIEASGVADPSAVAAYAHIDGFQLLGNLVLVDAVHAVATSRDALVGRTFARQIAAAHLIALTKCDETSEDELAIVRDLVTALAPTTPITQASTTGLAQLLDMDVARPSTPTDEGHAQFTTMTLDHVAARDKEQLLHFINNFPPTVVRAKGVVELADGNRLLIQKVGSTVTISETALPTSGLVVISAEPSL